MDRVHNDKSLIGIIEKEPGHYVAWLLKENEGLKYWYQIILLKYYKISLRRRIINLS